MSTPAEHARWQAAQTKRRRTQLKIREAVRQLLDEAGDVRAVTYKRVSELSGVSVATLYRYAPNRVALIQEGYNALDLGTFSAEERVHIATGALLAALQDLSPVSIEQWGEYARQALEEGADRQAMALRMFEAFLNDTQGTV